MKRSRQRAPVIWGILILLITSLLLIFRSSNESTAASDGPLPLPPPPVVDANLIDNLLPRDSIPAIDDPQFEPAEAANTHLPPTERIIGLIINGDARAYPITILSSHEIVNDSVGGEPVAITWCPLCYTALVFSREADAQTLTFGVSGKLLQNTLVMYDRQTDSLWSQLYGAAIDGTLTGQTLSFFPSTFTEWAIWYEQYPQSLVLSKEATCAQFDCGSYASNPRGSYTVDPYASYYNTPTEGVVSYQIPREEGLSPKKRVLGIRLGAHARAYPYAVLNDQPLIQDEFNNIPVLIWFDRATQTGKAYLRQVDEEVLTFRLDPDEPSVLVDEATNGRWQALTGQEINGTRQLSPLIATSAFEFGWYGYFPHSDTYVLQSERQ